LVKNKPVTKTSDQIGSCRKEQDENHTCFFNRDNTKRSEYGQPEILYRKEIAEIKN
jgi:hypothetical protein